MCVCGTLTECSGVCVYGTLTECRCNQGVTREPLSFLQHFLLAGVKGSSSSLQETQWGGTGEEPDLHNTAV